MAVMVGGNDSVIWYHSSSLATVNLNRQTLFLVRDFFEKTLCFCLCRVDIIVGPWKLPNLRLFYWTEG